MSQTVSGHDLSEPVGRIVGSMHFEVKGDKNSYCEGKKVHIDLWTQDFNEKECPTCVRRESSFTHGNNWQCLELIAAI